MKLNFPAFAFIMTLAAVINGMGIVRLLASFAEYLRRQSNLEIVHYWVFNLWIAFQFLLHILLWWSLWNTRAAEAFTFLHYLYLLSGPILLYLGASLFIPDLDLAVVHYFCGGVCHAVGSSSRSGEFRGMIAIWPLVSHHRAGRPEKHQAKPDRKHRKHGRADRELDDTVNDRGFYEHDRHHRKVQEVTQRYRSGVYPADKYTSRGPVQNCKPQVQRARHLYEQ